MKRYFIASFLFVVSFFTVCFINCSAANNLPNHNENVGGFFGSSGLSGYGGKNQGGEYYGGQGGIYFDAGADVIIDSPIDDATNDAQDGSLCLQKEICGNGIDDDCNFKVDDTCICVPDGNEICDGKDNDCDGEFDENIIFDQWNIFCGRENGPWNAENGICYYGLTSCVDTKMSCSFYNPSFEDYCNNYFDDDCDGLIDEGCPCIPGTKSQCYGFSPLYTINDKWKTTKCGNPFYMYCNDLGFYDGICPADIFPSTEICGNGQDEDCDGLQDDICP